MSIMFTTIHNKNGDKMFFFLFQILRRADKNGKIKNLQFLFFNRLRFRSASKEEYGIDTKCQLLVPVRVPGRCRGPGPLRSPRALACRTRAMP